jgi:hypothetical protein
MDSTRLLLVGIDEPEVEEIIKRLDCAIVSYQYLPRLKLVEGQLWVESRTRGGRFLTIDRVVYHGIYGNDFDFITLLALWDGLCFPDPVGMMDMRLRHPSLARVLRVTRFGNLLRGMSLECEPWQAKTETVAKWGNWHCGENKARFSGEWTPSETTLFEPFIDGEAVRIVLMGDKYWQIRLTGDNWLKSIHHRDAVEMEVDRELLDDTRQIAQHFNLGMVGVDYMVDRQGEKYLLEVNHIPNVTVFPFIREAFIDFVASWCATTRSIEQN